MPFWKRKRAPKSNGPAARWMDLLAAIGDSETDLMRVAGPEDGGSVCTDWVGAAVSISGADRRYPSLVDALEDGLFHAGCRHSLLPYRPEEGEAEALFCTKLALAGMTQRGLDRGAVRGPRPGSSLEEPRARFAQIYDQAREAGRSRRPEMALHFCQEALALVSQQNVFGEDQPGIERVLRGRMQTILRAHQRPGVNAGNPCSRFE